MKINQLLVLSLSVIHVLGGKAPKIKKNPADVIAIADFPASGDKNVKGNVVFTAKEGKIVNVHVDMTGLPKSGGPFVYHIHEFPVPPNGDCEAVGQHFNPYDAPPDCSSQKSDAHCQVGDLSGKHGWINTTCFETKYDDKFLSLDGNSKSSILGRALVFHYDNLSKFACANIVVADTGRIQNLETEYIKNGNEDLNELQKFVASNYVFEGSEEVFEKDDELKQRHLESSHNHTDDSDDDCDYKTNHSNKTNISLNGLECENGGSSFTLPIISTLMGIFGGLLI
ncbi:cell surface superoxide dismutase [Cu-Zn] 6 [[Candida] jaroonii]|uniref:Cell surface superoxide dismutase [Cu-Zn] 6 n=1 Tax=[Candida] jaroonii TaxID=467808 RepID=A0ACA9Y1D6_9ASCO|nr:cell surface superoxide dismutase [Cu-Zn] 6 [[Candida] jaroonii]